MSAVQFRLDRIDNDEKNYNYWRDVCIADKKLFSNIRDDNYKDFPIKIHEIPGCRLSTCVSEMQVGLSVLLDQTFNNQTLANIVYIASVGQMVKETYVPEMYVGVYTTDVSPVARHMGINRSPTGVKTVKYAGLSETKNISLALHGFVATKLDKLYFISAPVNNMKKKFECFKALDVVDFLKPRGTVIERIWDEKRENILVEAIFETRKNQFGEYQTPVKVRIGEIVADVFAYSWLFDFYMRINPVIVIKHTDLAKYYL